MENMERMEAIKQTRTMEHMEVMEIGSWQPLRPFQFTRCALVLTYSCADSEEPDTQQREIAPEGARVSNAVP